MRHIVRHCGLVVSAPAGTEQVVSLIPGSVGYIFHVHWAYDYLGPFGVLWVYIWLDTKIVLKIPDQDDDCRLKFSWSNIDISNSYTLGQVQTSELFRPVQIKPRMHLTNIWYLQSSCSLVTTVLKNKTTLRSFFFSPRETLQDLERFLSKLSNTCSFFTVGNLNETLYIWGGGGRVRLFVGNRGSGRVHVSPGRGRVVSKRCDPWTLSSPRNEMTGNERSHYLCLFRAWQAYACAVNLNKI